MKYSHQATDTLQRIMYCRVAVKNGDDVLELFVISSLSFSWLGPLPHHHLSYLHICYVLFFLQTG